MVRTSDRGEPAKINLCRLSTDSLESSTGCPAIGPLWEIVLLLHDSSFPALLVSATRFLVPTRRAHGRRQREAWEACGKTHKKLEWRHFGRFSVGSIGKWMENGTLVRVGHRVGYAALFPLVRRSVYRHRPLIRPCLPGLQVAERTGMNISGNGRTNPF